MSPEAGRYGFETRAIHAGSEPDPSTGAVVPPVSLATTFAQSAVGEHQGYDYSRTANPSRVALETCLASLEGAAHGRAFASGMAAENAILHLFTPGDHLLIPDDAYGGTFRLIDKVWQRLGITSTSVPLHDLDAAARAWRPETRLVWTETPSNPMLAIVDIAALAGLAHDRGGRLVIDNTFATPYLQQPLGSAPIWSCTRPPSTSAATATWSAGSWRPTTMTWRPTGVHPKLGRRRAWDPSTVI